MLIDTHCHLDAAEFDADRMAVARAAREAGVQAIVIPAVERANFATVRQLAHAVDSGAYALGIHPLYVARARDEDLDSLRRAIESALPDPRFVAIGEIGLDFFVAEIASGAPRERQERFTPPSSTWRPNTACRCCCMCGARKTSYSSICGAGRACPAASRTLSTAARNRPAPSSSKASRWAWAGP